MNRKVFDVGTVVHNNHHKSVLVGIGLGIFAALVVGAGLALLIMKHLRKKERGEKQL